MFGDDPPRVVVNGRFLAQRRTGVQRYAFELSCELSERVRGVRVWIPRRAAAKLDARARPLPLDAVGGGAGHVWEQCAIPRALGRAGNPLLVGLGNTGPLRYPHQVLTLHDVSFLRHPEWFSRRFVAVYRRLVPRVARRALAVVTDSEFSRREISALAGVDSSRLHVIPCGVSALFRRAAESSSPAENGSYLLAVGSLDPRKNLARLIRAYARLDHTQTELWIVGSELDCHRRSETRRLAETTPGVRLLGSQSDEELAALYRRALAFVFPSLYEGFGLPVIEAMASGCPVVASSAASLPEVCGEAALSVDPCDVSGLTGAIDRIIRDADLRRELRDRGLERSRSYTWERAGERYAALVDELLGGRESPE